MKLIHLTVKRFKHATADSIYISKLAENFSKILGHDYLLIVGNRSDNQFKDINIFDLKLNDKIKKMSLRFWLPYIYNIFWLPYFIWTNKSNNSETVFFSSDANLLFILILWKKIFRFKYNICSDWHMLHRNFKDRYVSVNSDFLITTSEKLKKNIIDVSGVRPDKIQVVYGGVDIENYEIPSKSRSELGLPENKKLISYVGLFKTMGMEKGITTMIEALKYLNKEDMMVFVGSRSGQKDEYINIAKSMHVEDRCLFFDMQPIEKIAAYEKAMDILVIPYPDKPHFRDFGFPMKVYEYMASRKPIIYSKLDLVEEVIRDCAVGFEADNAKELAQKIIEIEKNKSHYFDLADKAYCKVKEYSWHNKAEKIITFISKEAAK